MPLIKSVVELGVDRTSEVPLVMQLTEQIRQAVLTGQLKPNARLPSTRAIAEEIGVSRATILSAFEQLIAEGYLEGKHGSGTRVATSIPDKSLKIHSIEAADFPKTTAPARKAVPHPFQLGVFDSEHFPHKGWGKVLGRIWQNPPEHLVYHNDPFGYLPLRVEIARHLHSWRGLTVKPEQVIITSGGADSLSLIRDALLTSGDKVWFEEPGYLPAREILNQNGIQIVPVPVDDLGMKVNIAIASKPNARAAFVTPARHFPTGVTMPLARRLELINWARKQSSFIIEDDYESEHRYIGQPLPALMSLAPERLLYIGTFSKVFSPILRLGYLIVPTQFIAKFQQLRQTLSSPASLLAQPALAKFMESGAFVQHIRRMRRIHSMRRQALITALCEGEPHLFRIQAPPAGLSLLLSLPEGSSDVKMAEQLKSAGIDTTPLSPMYPTLPASQGLLLGYSSFSEEELQSAADRLLSVLARAFPAKV